MRCTPRNVALFEQRLQDIELLEGLTPHEKVEAFRELGLEISLNSGDGTKLLVDQLLWQIAGWHNPLAIADTPGVSSAEGLLTSIATSLWEMGVQAVEYGLARDTVGTILDAVENVYVAAGVIAANAAQGRCRSALANMLHSANSRGRGDVVQLLQSSLLLANDGRPVPA